ncbi:unnamed protein product [Tuber melanosporum]|uniref:(Perigord truffle) hypothetical protein n=1 Tax=Tuber melanosporum (strain Mel28) TaxID=656061 RepID=D5GFW0_TUBMM|nr:uncharacterized protein GSTUM_00007111001 [Tuber melanosporum]CAZ83403.1 unnamed protein product [Tuber melanosporum]
MELLELPLLVLEEILSHIPYDDSTTLSRLALTSRALYHLSVPRLYHTLQVVALGGKVGNREVLRSPGWKWWGRKVVVIDGEEEGDTGVALEHEEDCRDDNGWAEVAEVVSEMEIGRLRDFKFISQRCAPAQTALSAALSKHSLRTLKLTMHPSPSTATATPVPAPAPAPATNPAPTIPPTPPSPDPMLTCLSPAQHLTLQKLSINHINPDNEPEMISMYTTLKLLPLTSLSLKSRAFTDLDYVPLPELHPSTHLCSIKLYGFDIPPPEYCAETFFNPAYLRKLVLWECRGFDSLLSYLSKGVSRNCGPNQGLEELSLYTWEEVPDIDGVITFIASCRSLKRVLLNLSSFTESHMKALICALGNSRGSLESLTVQVRESVTTRALYYRPEWLASLKGFTKLEGLGMNYEMKGLKLSNITPTLPLGLKALEIRLRGELLAKPKTKTKVISQTRGIGRAREILRNVLISDGDYFEISWNLKVKHGEKVSVEELE